MKSILVVDDEEKIREMLGALLRHQNFHIYLASTVQDAYLSFQTYKPDLVLTDLLIPVGNGFWLLEQIRKTDSVTPVVLMSGDDIVYEKVNHVAAGFRAVFNKAQELDQMIEFLKKELGLDEA